ncbi:tyrosine-type recombinase/integrase [Brevundimonas vesicularis]|uniref:tyrosine-type recombinase/integrase n=1 Tax=Brevundimonas vesicularis TaxID=41276 RepID=UPI0030C1B6FC
MHQPSHLWSDRAAGDCALNAKLRACDLVKLRVSDVAPGGSLKLRSTVIQQKTERPVPFEITEPARDAIAAWLEVRGAREDDWLFKGRSHDGCQIGTRQYARLVDQWIRLIDLEPAAYGTHSLRRTKVSLVYKRTDNLRTC